MRKSIECCGKTWPLFSGQYLAAFGNHIGVIHGHHDWGGEFHCPCGLSFKYWKNLGRHLVRMSDEEFQRHLVMIETMAVMK